MGTFSPKAFDTTAVKSGLSISLSEAKAGQFFRIGITHAAQAKYFGGALDGGKDALTIELSDDPKSHHLMTISLAEADEAGALTIAGGIKGSLSIKLAPWCQLAPGKRSAVELPVMAQVNRNSIKVKLPEWARPPAKKLHQGEPLLR